MRLIAGTVGIAILVVLGVIELATRLNAGSSVADALYHAWVLAFGFAAVLTAILVERSGASGHPPDRP